MTLLADILGDGETSTLEAMKRGVLLSGIPSLAMILMAGFVNYVKVPGMIEAALQHLAAGIVFSAVAVELVPIIDAAPKSQIWAICVGFFVGIGTFLVLGACLPEDEDEDEGEEDKEAQDEEQRAPRRSGLLQQSFSAYRERAIAAAGRESIN